MPEILSIAERFNKLEAKVAEQAKHIEALECTDVFSRQVLKRIEALDKQMENACKSLIYIKGIMSNFMTPVCPDPFGEYAEPIVLTMRSE